MTEQPVCRIVGAGEGFPAFLPLQAHRPGTDLLLAADGGLPHVQRAGLVPDVILGDFDSLGYVPAGENVQRWPEMKDDTDTMLAIRLGLEKGFRRFYLYGGTGGRADHTLANLQALAFLAGQGAAGFLLGERQTFAAVRCGRVNFPAAAQGLLSVFAQGGRAQAVTLQGLLYPLEQGVLTPDFPLGVSNSFTGEEAEIRVENGGLLLCWEAPVLPQVQQLLFDSSPQDNP